MCEITYLDLNVNNEYEETIKKVLNQCYKEENL